MKKSARLSRGQLWMWSVFADTAYADYYGVWISHRVDRGFWVGIIAFDANGTDNVGGRITFSANEFDEPEWELME